MREIVRSEEILGGDPRIEGTRVGVVHVVKRYDAGDDPAQIAADYDIDVADVYYALAYYHDNPGEMDRIETRRREFVESIRRERPDAAERA